MLASITPVILTCNEAPNIARTLERLQWAGDIVVVDSFSGDSTLSILARFPRVRVFQRRFDTHANQWNYALDETGIETEWVLALDADYLLTDEFVAELQLLSPGADIGGFRAGFRYCVCGRPLRGAVYPPVTVLYRRKGASYRQDGHTQRVAVPGSVRCLKYPILHDDRKPLGRWVLAQDRYMRLEARKLKGSSFRELGWADRLRKMLFFAPAVMFAYCLFVRGAILDGRAGLYYGMQRMFAEMLLSLYLMHDDLGLCDAHEEPKPNQLQDGSSSS